ncbi:MAG: nitrilase-related carbon-nitrogen hydrolase [Thermoprotei archaeon]|jgi:predicted amidohydrolase
MRIAVSQYVFRVGGGFKEFADHVTRHTVKAWHEKAEIIVFPELISLELIEDKKLLGKPSINLTKILYDHYSKYVEIFSELTERYDITILAGSTVTLGDDGNYYNTAHVFRPDGPILKYKKIHLHLFDKQMGLHAGNDILTFKHSEIIIGTGICYDVGFPEIFRIMRLDGAEIFLIPSLAPGRGAYNWIRFSSHARAIESQGIVALSSGIDPTGELFGYKLRGKSAIITTTDYNPNGFIIEGNEEEDTVLIADIDMTHLREIQEKTAAPVLKDLNFKVYKELCDRKWSPNFPHNN